MGTIFRMEDENITMVHGNTLSFGLEIEGLDGDLEFAYFTCKKNFNDPNNIFQKTLGHGISKLEEGKYVIRIAPTDTANVEAGNYFYDLTVGANGDVLTLVKGVFRIEQNVTEVNNNG